ncbi:MAG TPA: hypothetical protein VF941_03330 [Clostridia bacterium]
MSRDKIEWFETDLSDEDAIAFVTMENKANSYKAAVNSAAEIILPGSDMIFL